MVYILLAAAILLNVAGQLLLKRASMVVVADPSAVTSTARSLISPWFVGGAACLGGSAVVWVSVLKKLPLTVVHPLTGVVFILVPILSHFLWNEPLPPLRLLGIGIIMVGVYLVARGGS